ncbi:multicopper oxidase family protein [Isoptericola variabilis]|uniref:Multicopper oxidase type 3 n=1 Tax=Isoptericola variabilis (strain 225) TaxID=743718 RepID=F6FW18_ISOV2|nr:multicopper oxidase family protein [Isoptericola variabilis]AEG44488.1 multicopper oxidase type 3 [Isoptericola variabilis 225]TWH26598.1 FtsP/CotA-like multicopper oxidase with cupredoxin domain [Isoptericola variabilis J7]
MAAARPAILGRVVAGVAAAAVVVPVGWFWQASLVPAEYSVMDMGTSDAGSGPRGPGVVLGAGGGGHPGHGHDGGARLAVDQLVEERTGPPDVAVTLVARAERVEIAPGVEVDAYTVNGSTPGPTVRATQGDLVEVTFVNESVPDGATLHWHGMDVPNAVDGVAGVTQDAVGLGEEFTYRFVAEDAGTYWYHSHQVSHEQVRRGLLGAVVVGPAPDAPAVAGPDVAGLLEHAVDVTAVVHQFGPHRTVAGVAGDLAVDVPAGGAARVRVVNTDDGTLPVWVTGSAFRLLAIDGTDVHAPPEVREQAVSLTAGARADLLVTVPDDGTPVRVELGGSAAVVLGPAGATAEPTRRPEATLDPLTYGEPAPLGLDPAAADRHFTYTIGRRPGFVDGRPGMQWTVNGRTFPDVPMFTVREGDVVRMTLSNASGEAHPMHLHGHHVVVLERDGVPASGSPWWVDSLDVRQGETYEVAFVADNPGVWMDHCHNLPHAAEGLVAHLMYEGVTTPYLVGRGTVNRPE